MVKRVAIFGSTGSIGKQALEVISAHEDKFSVEVLTAHSNQELLVEQALKFSPNIVVIVDETKYDFVKKALAHTPVKVFAGERSLSEVAAMDCYDLMLAAIVGFAGLSPTLSAIENGKTVALANKETLVVAGDLVMRTAIAKRVPVIPVDSEHSAIFQCLVGEQMSLVEKLVLTASGGPFLGKKTNYLANVKKEHALQHPNWTMGAKITIDSATLMNKGLEMIEAKWLFRMDPSQIEVVVHPQSIIHSMVQFKDGSMKAQMGLPDMRTPIQYALSFPHRLLNDYPRFDFKRHSIFSFEEPDLKTFRNLSLAIEAMHEGGNMPCVLNAANEIVVDAFLKNRVGFLKMTDLIEEALMKLPYISKPSLEEYMATDRETRSFVESLI